MIAERELTLLGLVIGREYSAKQLTKLAGLMDRLRYRYGRDTLRLASQHYNPEWPMQQNYLSPRYTTRWSDILKVR